MGKKDLDDRMDAVEADVAALSDRVSALENASPASDPSAGALNDLGTRVTALEAEVFPLKTDVAPADPVVPREVSTSGDAGEVIIKRGRRLSLDDMY